MDDQGQLMLLAAVVVILGFVGLATSIDAPAIEVGQPAPDRGRAAAIEAAVVSIHDTQPTLAAFEGILGHFFDYLIILEASQGVAFEVLGSACVATDTYEVVYEAVSPAGSLEETVTVDLGLLSKCP